MTVFRMNTHTEILVLDLGHVCSLVLKYLSFIFSDFLRTETSAVWKNYYCVNVALCAQNVYINMWRTCMVIAHKCTSEMSVLQNQSSIQMMECTYGTWFPSANVKSEHTNVPLLYLPIQRRAGHSKYALLMPFWGIDLKHKRLANGNLFLFLNTAVKCLLKDSFMRKYLKNDVCSGIFSEHTKSRSL